MGHGRVPWIDAPLDWSVTAFRTQAALAGIRYEEINMGLFRVAWPLVTTAMLGMIVRLWRENRSLSRFGMYKKTRQLISS